MGIEISAAVTMPAITYNRIHLTRLEITQPTFADDALPPVYRVAISYRHYGVVDGVRYYANEDVQIVALNDFLAAAMADAAQGDMTLIAALQSIESAVAAIINDQAGEQATVV